jgi:isochorismate synthase
MVSAKHSLFIAATPELLVQKSGARVRAQALAGSVPAGDAACSQLLASAKDAGEHALVVAAIRSRLAPFCSKLEVGNEPRAREYGDIVHLETPIKGDLLKDQHVLDLVRELHPTPAVGGVPTPAALRWIRENEAVSRGWYASPVGWFDQQGDGEFVTAIRSALLVGNSVRLYAGAGIMADSDPESEFQETETKLLPMMAALGLSQ